MASELISLEESRRLVELEEVIEKGVSTFIAVGEALAEIRDKRLYRVTHGTFEEYCREEWNMTRMQASNLITGAAVAQNVNNCLQGGPRPGRESHVRPLKSLPAEKQPEAWAKAVESANGSQPTAKQVEAAVAEVATPTQEEAPKRERPFCPSNGMRYANLAIEALKKIQPNDTERDKAFMAVQRFLTQNYQPK